MKSWKEFTHFAALDWAKDHHDVVVVDRQGVVVADFRIAHDCAGWQRFAQKLSALTAVAVAIETSEGPAVEQLLASGFDIYPINPKSARRYRERKRPSGSKTDRIDAWSLADALRTDGHAWRRLQPVDPLLAELRQLCRDEVALIEERTALINQLQHALGYYYPAALEAFDDWALPSAWSFVEAFPTPEALLRAGRRKWERWLHANKLFHSKSNQRRLELFARANEWHASSATTLAKSLLAVSRVKMLRLIERQLAVYRRRIEVLFTQHPDHALFASLPGAGPKLAPRLLSEIGEDRARFENAQAVQCYAGTAPVSFQSGQISRVKVRRSCNLHLRQTVHLWVDLSRKYCAWAQAYYRTHRDRGQSHACALRCLGQRWLKILWKMWSTKTSYDAALHQQNQVKHGSWILQLKSA
jgi:transposase